MSKKQFTLDSWLKDKSQKVVTRCGFPVRIVCTDVKRKDYPILALVERDDQEEYQSFTKDGRFSLYNSSHDSFDLFIETVDEVSEDERIRKGIFKALSKKDARDVLISQCIEVSDALAWLEKQGQVKESTISQHENRTCEGNDDSLTYENERIRKEIINYFQCQSEEEPTRKEIHDKWIAWLENIPYTIDHEKREGFHLGYKAGLEKQGEKKPEENNGNIGGISANWSEEDTFTVQRICKYLDEAKKYYADITEVRECNDWLKSLQDRVQPQPKYNFGDTELTQEELCEGLIRGMVDEHNRVTKEVLRNEYEKGRADVLAKIDAIDVDEMVCESCATSRVTQYWYAHGVNDVIKKLKEEQV